VAAVGQWARVQIGPANWFEGFFDPQAPPAPPGVAAHRVTLTTIYETNEPPGWLYVEAPGSETRGCCMSQPGACCCSADTPGRTAARGATRSSRPGSSAQSHRGSPTSARTTTPTRSRADASSRHRFPRSAATPPWSTGWPAPARGCSRPRGCLRPTSSTRTDHPRSARSRPTAGSGTGTCTAARRSCVHGPIATASNSRTRWSMGEGGGRRLAGWPATVARGPPGKPPAPTHGQSCVPRYGAVTPGRTMREPR
jgi:hypothetical protein